MLNRIIFLLLFVFTNTFSYAKNYDVNLTPYFVYEFDTNLNPDTNNYGWCGHAALTTVANRNLSGSNKISMQKIHDNFLASLDYDEYRDTGECSGYLFCADLDWLHAYVYKKKSWGGLAWNDSVIRTTYSLDSFYNKVKDSMLLDLPLITPSGYRYSNVGHFWIIAGFEDNGNGNDSKIKLYDVAKPKTDPYYVFWVNMYTFWRANSNGKNDLLIVSPK